MAETNNATPYTLQYQTENCNCSDTISFSGCNSVMTYDLDDLPVESQGRVLQLNAKVKNVCPGRRTAVMISLHELDENDQEQSRGMKAFTLPAHQENGCRDITLSKVRFVLPEDLSLASSAAANTANNCGVACNARRFIARTFAHYVDSDYTCECSDQSSLHRRKHLNIQDTRTIRTKRRSFIPSKAHCKNRLYGGLGRDPMDPARLFFCAVSLPVLALVPRNRIAAFSAQPDGTPVRLQHHAYGREACLKRVENNLTGCQNNKKHAALGPLPNCAARRMFTFSLRPRNACGCTRAASCHRPP